MTRSAVAASPRDHIFEWASGLISSLPRNYSQTTREQNLELIKTLGARDVVSALIHEVLHTEELLAMVAGRSYRHTNHFDKIVLIDSGAKLGYRLTLHMWDPPYTEPEIKDEQIHDHRFSFWSKVLVGTMTFQNYARDASGMVHNEFQYIPEKLGVATVGNFYVDVGESPLFETERSGGVAGDAYHLPYSQIHRVVIPLDHMTCTMVLRGPRQKNYASVFSTSKKYDPTGNVMFTVEQLTERLARLLARLAEGQS